MANELNLSLSPAQTGLTITAILIQGNAQVGSAISCPESGTLAGHYSGNMPAVAAGVYGVRFLSAGAQVGTGVIDWDGTKERSIGDVPTVAQLEARTLSSADYFNPATDTVATVTSLTNAVTLPSIPSNWITAAGLAVDAVNEIQSGLATDADVTAILEDTGTTLPGLIVAIPTNPLITTDARLNNLDATISSRSVFNPATTGVSVNVNNDKTGYSLTQAFPNNFSMLGINENGHINRVTLVDTTTNNSDMRGTDGAITSVGNVTVGAYATGQSPADLVTGFATPTNITDAQSAIINHGNSNWTTATGFLTTLGTNAPTNWINAAAIATDAVNEIQSGLATSASIAAIPTNPLLTNDERLNNLDATISSRSTYNGSDTPGTTSLINTIGVNGSGLSAIPWNAAWDSEVQSEVLDGLTQYSVPTLLQLQDRTLLSGDYFNAAVDTVTVGSYATGQSPSTLVTGFATPADVTNAQTTIINQGNSAWTTATGFLTSLGANAPANWVNAASLSPDAVSKIQSGLSTFDGDLSSVTTAISAIPTNPLLTTDTRLDVIKAKTDQLTFVGGDVVSTLNGEEVAISTAGVNAIVAGVNGALVIPTAVQIRTEIDTNSTELAAIKTIAIGARNNAAAGL